MRPGLENIKVVDHKDRAIVTVVLIEIQQLLRLYSVSNVDLKFVEQHVGLLFYTTVRWLSRGKRFSRLYKLK